MNTPDAMRALTSGATTSVSAPMKDRGTVVVARRGGNSCPFTVTTEMGETKRMYKYRKVATAFQRAKESTTIQVDWSAVI